MTQAIDQSNLHRTAKYFMDSGRAETHEAAVDLLQGFGLTIHVGDEIAHSADHQSALLTLVNAARRTLLGGIEIVGLPDVMSVSSLAPNQSLRNAVCHLGGRLVSQARSCWPTAIIGTTAAVQNNAPSWRLTWEGWRGGVIPIRDAKRLSEKCAMPLAPVLAAAVCAAEAFAFHAGDHLMAGRRSQGVSLWQPGSDWLVTNATEPPLTFLPSRLWIIGLGNLGQAFAWLLACLPYEERGQAQFVLQDYDSINAANESTSLLASNRNLARKKSRVVAEWLEERGFQTVIEERRFGEWTQRMCDEPGAALCGVDNANARAVLEKAGFGLIVEAGLGAGPQGFRNMSVHCFPASRTAEEIWSKQIGGATENFEFMPAYQALRQKGIDGCGLTQLATRTVGVPFVGLIAACLVISELLRRLHGGDSFELVSASVAALEDIEVAPFHAQPYAFGHAKAIKC